MVVDLTDSVSGSDDWVFPDSGRRQRGTDRANPDPDCRHVLAGREATCANRSLARRGRWWYLIELPHSTHTGPSAAARA